jgi:hypothetical protein
MYLAKNKEKKQKTYKKNCSLAETPTPKKYLPLSWM